MARVVFFAAQVDVVKAMKPKFTTNGVDIEYSDGKE